MDTHGKLKLGIVVYYIYNIVHILASLVSIQLLTNFLGRSEYGLYSIVGSIFSYINILEISLSSATMKYYCEAQSGNDREKMENVLGICRRIYRILAVFIIFAGGIVVMAFRAFYASSMNVGELQEGSLMLAVMIAGIVNTLANSVYGAGIKANEGFVFLNGMAVIKEILQLLLYFLVVRSYSYGITVVAIQFVLNVMFALARYNYARNVLLIRPNIHNEDRQFEKTVIAFAASILLGQVADMIYWRTDQIVLAKFYDTAVAAVYSVASSVYWNYMIVGAAVTSVFFPSVSRYYREADGWRKISDLFIKVGRISFFVSFLILSGFILFGREFIVLWVGEEYLDAYGIAIIVMVPFTIEICQELGLTILQVSNQYAFRAKVYLVSAVINIGLTVVLCIPLAGYGAALSTGISLLLTSGIILNIYYAKNTMLDIRLFWKNIFGIAVRLLPLAVIAYVVDRLIVIESGVVVFVLKITAYVCVYFITVYVAVFNGYEKSIVKNLFARIGHLNG
jgi:O-antigen/teichoic acid export membrane protein